MKLTFDQIKSLAEKSGLAGVYFDTERGLWYDSADARFTTQDLITIIMSRTVERLISQ